MKRFYYAVICVCSTLFVMVSIGLTLNTFIAYAPYIIEEFNLNHTVNATFNTVRLLGATISVFFVDRYYRLFGIRKGMFIIAALVAASHLLCASASNVGQLYVGIFLMGILYGLGGMYPAAVLIRRWFHDRQALVVGIAACGTGLATIVGGPAVILCVERFGLLQTFRYEAWVMFALAILLGIFVVPSPDKMGMTPYVEAASATKAKSSEKKQGTIVASRIPLKTSRQMQVLTTSFLAGVIGLVSTAHLNVHLTNMEYNPEVLAALISFYGIALTVAKCIYGFMNDIFGSMWMNRFGFSMICLSMLLLAVADVGLWVVILALITMASGMPFSTVGMSVWAAELTTEEGYSKFLKNLQFFFILGGLITATVPGIIADVMGSYSPAYFLYFLCGAIGFVLVQTVYRRVKAENQMLTKNSQTMEEPQL